MEAKWKASFTVEAAFIIPLVSGVLLLLISTALYFRDVTVAKAILMKEVSQGASFLNYDVYPDTDYVLYERMLAEGFFTRLLQKDDKEAEQILAAHLQERLASAFFYAEPEDIEVSVDGGTLRMRLVLDGKKGLWGLGSFGMEKFFSQEVEASASCTDMTQWSRIVTTILRTGERIKGLQAVMEKIRQFLSWLGK